MSCEDCTRGNVLSGRPTGIIDTNTGAYLAPGRNPSSRAIVLLTDAFGLPLVNCKILADRLSRELACDVWVPDMFDGAPIFTVGSLNTPDVPGVKMTFMQTIGLTTLLIRRLPYFISNRPSKCDERIDKFIKCLKGQRKYKKIGAVGYCWGGACAIRLGSRDLVDSIVICHPGSCTIEEIKAIKIPAQWNCAEDDMAFSNQLQHEAETAFAERRGKYNFVEYEFHEYKGTTHGFAARPNISIPNVKAGFEGAFENTVNWFNKHLTV